MKNENTWLTAKAILDKLKEDQIISFHAWYYMLLFIRKQLNMPAQEQVLFPVYSVDNITLKSDIYCKKGVCKSYGNYTNSNEGNSQKGRTSN